MKTDIETVLKGFFSNVRPQLDSLLIRIECPFDSGIAVECEGRTTSGPVYPEPDMDALSDYVDELRATHPEERFNVVTIVMTGPSDTIIERTFDEDFQREAENMVRD